MPRPGPRLRALRALALAGGLGLAAAPRRAAASTSSDQLAAAAAAHEAAGHDDLAARRYTEALELDRGARTAWLGLARLRARRGDLREAERVCTAALAHLPADAELWLERGTVRRLLGDRDGAERDFDEAFARDPDVLERLAARYVVEGKLPAALATWRRRLAELDARADDGAPATAAAAARARTMVAALVVLVGEADPVAAPPGPRPTAVRATLARAARPPRRP